ncbi:MAG TPA: hypothetical protein VG935_01280, partial [Patescibacteria group bacterium]|nr:hypothetical protein [Patescibacteria group bacterium]
RPEDRKSYRTFKLFEHDRGEGYCGTCRVTLRRSPTEWMIQIEEEEYFPSEDEVRTMTRATRASVEKPGHEKLADGPHIEAGYGYANPRRIGGAPIKLGLVIKGWSPQLAGQMMSVRKFAKSLDLIGKGTFFSALVELPAEYADSIWHDLRHGSE